MLLVSHEGEVWRSYKFVPEMLLLCKAFWELFFWNFLQNLCHIVNIFRGGELIALVYYGEPFQAWEMWLSPHLEKPVGSDVGGQGPHPWIGSPVGNQACIVPRLLWDFLLLETPSP